MIAVSPRFIILLGVLLTCAGCASRPAAVGLDVLGLPRRAEDGATTNRQPVHRGQLPFSNPADTLPAT